MAGDLTTWKPLPWVGVSIVVLLVLGSVNPKLGGWLLLVLVIGMVSAARGRGMI